MIIPCMGLLLERGKEAENANPCSEAVSDQVQGKSPVLFCHLVRGGGGGCRKREAIPFWGVGKNHKTVQIKIGRGQKLERKGNQVLEEL